MTAAYIAQLRECFGEVMEECGINELRERIDITVLGVALSVGYANTAAMTRAFRRYAHELHFAKGGVLNAGVSGFSRSLFVLDG